jgi:hypothetical protein
MRCFAPTTFHTVGVDDIAPPLYNGNPTGDVNFTFLYPRQQAYNVKS